MTFGDWANSAVNLVIGCFLGTAAYGIIKLSTTSFWPLAIMIPLLFFGIFVIDLALDRIFHAALPGGTKPATKPKKKPVLRRLSLPTGLVIGFLLAWVGIGQPLLDRLVST